MINNDVQYKITLDAIILLSKALRDIDKRDHINVHPDLVELEKVAVRSEMDNLYKQVREYDSKRRTNK